MRRTRFDQAACPIARTTDLLGDWWTPLVLREIALGARRFGDIQARLDISKPILAQRLSRLVDEGVLERRPYQSNPPRHDHVLTDKGKDLFRVLLAMWRFGDDWLFDDAGAAVHLVDKRTGEEVRPGIVDTATGHDIDLASVRVRLR